MKIYSDNIRTTRRAKVSLVVVHIGSYTYLLFRKIRTVKNVENYIHSSYEIRVLARKNYYFAIRQIVVHEQ